MLKRIFQVFRTTFLAGLLVAVPLAVTVWVIFTIVGFIDAWIQPQWIEPLMAYYPPGLPTSNGRPPGLGVFTAIALILLLGLITRSYLGARIINFYERYSRECPFFLVYMAQLKNYLRCL